MRDILSLSYLTIRVRTFQVLHQNMEFEPHKTLTMLSFIIRVERVNCSHSTNFRQFYRYIQ